MAKTVGEQTDHPVRASHRQNMKVLYLDPDDDIVSICDRLEWSGIRQALLVLPRDGSVLRGGLDLPRLRRYADRERKEIGLVTADRNVVRQARALGLPAFYSIEEGLSGRRSWWRGRRRKERVGLFLGSHLQLASTGGAVPRDSEIKRVKTVSRRHWLLRYITILLFFATVSFFVVAVAYTLPRATISLQPEVSTQRTTVQVIADPRTVRTDFAQALMPARLLNVDLSWQAQTETTGSEVVPLTPARGRLLFLNLTEEEIEIPAGTVVSTTESTHIFQTVAPLTMVGVISSTAEIEAVALEAGPQNNVEAGTINRLEGSLAEVLTVTNPEPMQGGDVRSVATVTDEDRLRLRSQVLQFLQALAVAEMETTLTEREFLARDSLRVVGVSRETYSHQVGEQTSTLRLKVEASLQGTAIDLSEAAGLAYDSLARQVSGDFNLVTGSISYRQNEVLEADKDGRVTFVMAAEGLVAADIELEPLLDTISGQTPELATAYMYEALPLRDIPSIDVWPSWFNRVPYSADRIVAEVVAAE